MPNSSAKDMSEKKMTINEDRYHGWRFQPHVFSYGHEFCFLDGIIHSLISFVLIAGRGMLIVQ
jgi:hypothetical protein